MPVFSKISAVLTSIAFALLTACSGSSSPDPTVVAAEFSALGIKGTVNGQNITLDLSGLGNCATTVENMTLGVQANGASISPDPRVASDYSRPVQFTITAPDGTKVVYNVTVKGAECLTPAAPPVTPPVVPPVVPTACTAAAIGSTGYSLVFKGCSAANVAEYYDKTECVRDNATGLIWEGKPTEGFRTNTNVYTNFDSITALQKLDGNVYVAPTQADVDASTNSIGFKNAVNAIKLCGSANWRLPVKDELFALIMPANSPSIDNLWFVNTVNWAYWTSTSDVDHAYNAWDVHFDSGGYTHASGYNRYFAGYHLRLVRAGS